MTDEEIVKEATEAIFRVFYPHSPSNAFHPKTRAKVGAVIISAVTSARKADSAREMNCAAQPVSAAAPEQDKKGFGRKRGLI